MTGRAPTVPPHVHTALVPLRWGDMDSLGHVNNVIHLRLLEEARVQFLADLAPLGEHGYGALAARHEIDYLRPLHYSARPVQIRLWVERIGGASFTVASVVLAPEGEAVAAAKTVIVAIDPETGTPRALPQPLRDRLGQYLAA
jgi:acyl-CoA thioester hydrolase